MEQTEARSRRRFLKSMGIPALTILGASAPAAKGNDASPEALPGVRKKQVAEHYVDLGSAPAGDGAIPFRKHTLDLGPSEAVAVADVDRDGRLDIVCGENWYQQGPPEPDKALRFVKHKFRDLPYTDFYLEDLSDLAIDINGDGYPDVVTCSYWSKPLTWWENPGNRGGPWREHVMETRSPVEFALLVDIVNAGQPLQLLPQFGDENFPLTWYELAGRGGRGSLGKA